MNLPSGPVDPRIFYAVSALIAVLFAAWAGIMAIKARKEKQRSLALRKAITQYFQKSGVQVSVECALSGRNSYTAFIESEPMKQFRLSHIIESTLRDYLHNLHRLTLDKVYWRFPIRKDAHINADEENGKKPGGDEYFTEGLVHVRHLPKGEVMETSWETFEEAAVMPKKE